MAQYKGKEKDSKTKAKAKDRGPIWEYYEVNFLLRTEMLGTCAEASIMKQHVIEKAKKQIAKANRLDKRIKSLDKFKGSEIPEEKEISEIQGIIRTYMELTGKPGAESLPNKMDDLMEIAEEVQEDFRQLVKEGEDVKATVFMRDTKVNLGMKLEKGENKATTWPVISTHQILGNFKENANIVINGTAKDDKKKLLPAQLTTKVSVGEQFAMSVKPVQPFMIPSNDIVRQNGNGKRQILERIVRWQDQFGKTQTAIATSEMLPEGTTFGCVLRVRKDSPITEEFLKELLEYGKNNGLGSWRGSGNKGSYYWQLKKLPDYQEEVPEGWN